MNTVILDDCLFHLCEAQKCVDMYEVLDSFTEIFEADDPATQEKIEKNKKASTGALGHIKKAIDALIDLVKKIASSITDFFNKRFMSKKEREAYDAFKEACKKDPSLKNKKITVKDYRKINAEYEKILEEVRKTDKALAEGRECPVDEVIKKIKSFGSEFGEAASSAVTMDIALNMAKSNMNVARLIGTALNFEQNTLQSFRDAVGDKKTDEFMKEINKYSKRCLLKRAFLKLTGQISSNATEAASKTFKNILELCPYDPETGKMKGKIKMTKAAVKNRKMFSTMMGNETVNDAAKKSLEIAKDSVKKKIHINNAANKLVAGNEIKNAKKKIKSVVNSPFGNNDVNKSALDFFTDR